MGVSESDPALISTVFEAQQRTALAWRVSTPPERMDRIRRLCDTVLANRQALYEAFRADFRKGPDEVDSHEILPVLSEAQHTMAHLRRWMKPRRAGTTLLAATNTAWIDMQPRGRVLIIAPWNFPMNLCFGPLVSALAAGNTVILKPSELTPHVSALMGRLVAQTFRPDEVALFEGGQATSTALLDLPFDHVFFTGSPRVGQVVMAAASRHLSSVTLELGGKSPMIVDETSDVRRAAENVMWGKLINSGQVCLAVDHVHVHASVKADFVAACVKVLQERYGATPSSIQAHPALTRIVNRRHAERLAGLLDDARQAGARVIVGGQVDLDDHYVAPTLLDEVPAHARILHEEIFGPLLPIMAYTDLAQLLSQINDRPKPLALYLWTSSRAHERLVRAQTSSGGMCVNHCVLHSQHAGLPFGGVNHSGLGNAHGWWGFKAFSHERGILRSWRVMLASLMAYPPVTPFKRRAMTMMLRLTRWRMG